MAASWGRSLKIVFFQRSPLLPNRRDVSSRSMVNFAPVTDVVNGYDFLSDTKGIDRPIVANSQLKKTAQFPSQRLRAQLVKICSQPFDFIEGALLYNWV